MTITNNIPTLLCDFYKVSHMNAFPEGTSEIYSTLVPRNTKHFQIPNVNEIVVSTFQYLIKEYLINFFNENFFSRPVEDVVNEYVRYIKFTLGQENPDASHIAALHGLGYLPLEIYTIDEGTKVPVQTPILTIVNTHPDFYWLPNYFETLLSSTVWQGITSATIASKYRELLNEYAIKTTGSTDGVDFQGHDFSFRGMSSLESAMISGAAHLYSFFGTDTIAAIMFLERFYNANIEKEMVGASIPATEHSVMSANTPAFNGDRNELETYRRLITEVFPSGFASIVSDTYDFWSVVENILPQLKEDIMNRDGRIVIRPDSGNPVDVICGTLKTPIFDNEDHARERLESIAFDSDDIIYLDASTNKYMVINHLLEVNEYNATSEEKGLIHCLWDIFEGTISDKGFKLLDPHIGAIYGDSITYQRAKQICQRLYLKGFASTNIVFGIGSYTYQFNTRDSLGLAIKATHAKINGENVILKKEPKTDLGKKSHAGKVFVCRDENGEIITMDRLNHHYIEMSGKENLLTLAFQDGKLIKDHSLSEIRERLANN